jgi:hypothetical protein
LSADQERFQRWRTIEGVNNEVDPLGNHRDLETLVRGIFNKCPASTPLADSRQPSWPVSAPRLSLATTWGRRHEN